MRIRRRSPRIAMLIAAAAIAVPLLSAPAYATDDTTAYATDDTTASLSGCPTGSPKVLMLT